MDKVESDKSKKFEEKIFDFLKNITGKQFFIFWLISGIISYFLGYFFGMSFITKLVSLFLTIIYGFTVFYRAERLNKIFLFYIIGFFLFISTIYFINFDETKSSYKEFMNVAKICGVFVFPCWLYLVFANVKKKSEFNIPKIKLDNKKAIKRNISKEEVKKQLLELKEYLDLGIITKEEFDNKAKSLKKILLGN